MKQLPILVLIATLFCISCHQRAGQATDSCCSKKHGANVSGAMSAGAAAQASPASATTAVPASPSSPAALTTPDMSVYQLAGQWTDQDNRHLELNSFRGKVQLVAMIYTSCGYTCPRLVADMKSLRSSLPDSIRDQIGCVLVTMDPDRDTPARLRQFAAGEQLDRHWELLRGTPDQVRELSMVLNVQYKDLGNGNFSHTANILVLDKKGRIIGSLQGSGVDATAASALIGKIASR